MLLSAPAAAAQQTTPQEVTVNFLNQGEPDTLDPNRASFGHAVDAAVVRQVFEPLLRFDANLVPQPAAAESYEVSLDGTIYTFHLRPDGRWSDGQPVTAQQFEYSWKRLLDPALHAEYAGLFVDAGIVNVSALDDRTLRVQLNQPFGALPDLAALGVAVPLRQDIVGAEPDGWAKEPSTYVGNGPFMLIDWTPQDHLMLAPNPYYATHLGWPRPMLTRVTVLMAARSEADFAGFQQGTRDWALVPDTEVNAVLNDPVLSTESRQYNELTTFWVQINNAHAPLNNVLVRRALAKAIDRTALVRDLATGVSVPATSIIPPGMPGFQDGLGHELGLDPSGGRALLAQAGFSSGQSLPKLTFSFPDTPQDLTRARFLQAQWETNLGIAVALDPLEAGAYQTAIDSRNYDLALGGWSADYPDSRDWFSAVFGCKGTYNTFNYCDSAFDQLAARADTAITMSDRLQLYGQAQTLLMQDLPVAPLFVRGRLVLVKPWVQSTDGSPLPLSPLDEYPGSLFLDKVQILPH